MDHRYWQRQTTEAALFPDALWAKPERRDQAGKLLIVGGNKLGFAAVAESYTHSLQNGVGQTKVLLPSCLKGTVPATLLDVVFADCTPSGSLSKEAEASLQASAAWADGVLLIGDAGRNAETALLYESFLQSHSGPVTITRDAIDLVKNNPSLIADRPDTLIVASFAQVQKLFAGVYYPKMLTFSMQLLQLVESLHKFTITYPCTIVTLHKETIIVAHNGEVVTQEWQQPMAIWRGSVATDIASWRLWHANPLEAVASALASS